MLALQRGKRQEKQANDLFYPPPPFITTPKWGKIIVLTDFGEMI
jgi:hypothetical protein